MKLLKFDYIYNNNFNIKFINNNIFKTIIINIVYKKIIQIIYKFHSTNKQILFLGINKTVVGLLKLIKAHHKHLFIPNQFWVNGILTNYLIFNTIHLSKRFHKLFIKLKSKYTLSLIIIFKKFSFTKEVIKSNILNININNTISTKPYLLQFGLPIQIQNKLFYLLLYKLIKFNNIRELL